MKKKQNKNKAKQNKTKAKNENRTPFRSLEATITQ